MISKLHPETQRGFLIALGGLFGVYLLSAAIALLGASSYVEALEDSLASSMVAIEEAEPELVAADFSNFHSDYEVDDALALLQAPLPELVEESAFGPLPVISPDGLTPFKAYQRPFALPRNGRFLALAVTDFGISDQLSRDMVGLLPPNVTLLASPYASNANQWAQAARRYGHEIWLHVPMETKTYPEHDTGPLTLLQRSSLRLNLDRLEQVMSASVGYSGLYSNMDDSFKYADTLVRGMFDNIFQRGLGYFELGNAHPIAETMAAKHSQAYLKSSVYVDGYENAYKTQLDALMDVIDAEAFAIGVLRPTPALINMLPSWLDSLQQQGITLVPLSSFYQN